MTALSRVELLLLFPLVVIPLALLVNDADWGRRFRLAIVACLVGGVVLGPWVIFNSTRFKEPTTMTTATGSALSAASCDEVFYGTLIGYYANCFQGPWPSPKLDESQRDLVPRHTAAEYIKDHLSRIPIVVAARVGRLWGLFKPGQTTAFGIDAVWRRSRSRTRSWTSAAPAIE